jgi:DNA polymerase II large subunit
VTLAAVSLAAVTLELGDYAALGTMLAVATSVPAMLLLANVKGLSRRIDVVEDRVGKTEKGKADKHEWARETILARDKMEQLSGQLQRLEAKLDANFGVAANIARLVDEMGKWREAKPHG